MKGYTKRRAKKRKKRRKDEKKEREITIELCCKEKGSWEAGDELIKED